MKFVTATEFPGQKLSFLLEIYDLLSFQVKNSLFYIKFMTVLSFLVKNSLIYMKFMTAIEFPGQKLSFTSNL